MVPLHAHSVHVGKRGRLQARRHPDSLRRSHVDLEVIIPAYNEAGRIATTLTQTVDFLAVQPWSSRIVVVDNGSVDETAAVVHRISREKGDAVPISVLGCSRRGKGAAVRRGLLSGTSRYTGFFDADLATPLATLTEAMAQLAGGAAAVIASRHAPGSTFVVPQHIGRRMGGTAFRALTKSKVKGIQDTQCGFKFFERDALTAAMVQCRSTGFAFDVELLLRLQDNDASIVELPVAWTDGAESTFRPFQDGVASFASVIQLQKATS
ncbi:glycosyltransferase [Paenarthrobacter nitroguajacolicus]|mgnify:CR=1 FL=1|uniref:glycosyltransferase n=1 Tax=Paenarthrobacter nitroguajacolicus TaxID=211146 RepID=UPI001C4BE961|nr:glycosyltransferase [Paenarthrobacter nitroguajacolicus]NWL32142.1 glycosyl transferase family 2 [Paenarthrobacter nitroguajacolicus]